MTALRSELPDLKQWWNGLSNVYSKVLQIVVERLFDNLNGFSKLKETVTASANSSGSRYGNFAVTHTVR